MMSEQQIFEKLSTLCGKKGFIYTLAEIWFSDNYYKANENGNFTASNIIKFQINHDKLHRNELNTLLALVIKNNPNFFNDDKPSQELSAEYRDTANKLLEDFHKIFKHAFYAGFRKFFTQILSTNKEAELLSPPKESDVFLNENSIREAIFYSGDGVYDFQYQDLGYAKYINDNPWFIENKKFSIEHALFAIEIIYRFHHQKIEDLGLDGTQQPIPLEAFIYSKDEFIDFFEKNKKT